MSRVDNLIAQLCPNGVPFRPLGDIAHVASERADPDRLDGSTYVGVDNLLPNFGGRRDSDYLAGANNAIQYKPGDVLVGNIRPYLKKVWLADRDGGASPDVVTLSLSADSRKFVLPAFLFYLMASDPFIDYAMRHAKGGKMPRGDRAAILRYRIPVPPVEVQREVVRVLDTFTDLVSVLDEESALRRRQQVYYRDSLMTFGDGDNVRWEKIGDIATVVRGASPRPIQSYLTSESNGVPWIKIGDVPADGKYITRTAQRVTREGAAKSRIVKPGDFVLSNSMSFGRPYISRIEGAIHDGWLAISGFSDAFGPDFLYHLLRSGPIQSEFARRAGSSTVSNLNAEIVRAVVVPVPTREAQHRIAQTLDAFESLVDDPSCGISAEIHARRRQFEYYRDRLLAFDEAVA